MRLNGGLKISGGEGLFVDNSDVRLREGAVVELSRIRGIGLGGEAGSSLRLLRSQATPPLVIEVRNNCGNGINVACGSNATVFEGSISDNEGFGVFAFDTGRITVTTSSTFDSKSNVSRNVRGGIRGTFGAVVVVSGQAVIDNNGDNPDTDSVFFRNHSGVNAYFGTQVLIRGPIDPETGMPTGPGPIITGNIGPGILVDSNSNVRLENATVDGNTDGGLKLTHQSLAEIGPAPTTLSGNGFADLDCDQSSLAFGDLTGVANNRCQGTPEPGGQGQGRGAN